MNTPHESHQHYQLAVIGSGSGGREATLLAARKGLQVALIEGGRIGGACFHSGCYAVRALQACAHQFRANLRSGRFGNHVDLLKTTLDDWMIAQQKASSRLTDAFRAELSELHVDLFEGYAEFLGDRLIQVLGAGGSRTTVTADNVIVATGSRPDFHASAKRGVVNSDELLRMPTLPKRLVIIGAGYIGCEFASIYRTLGSAVTLIEKENRVLPTWEREAGERVAQALVRQGVTVLLDQSISLDQIDSNLKGVWIGGSGDNRMEADLILMATGRVPNSRGIGLEVLGIDDRSFLKVDKQMRLPAPGLYAVGDVNGISLLDSTAFSQASVAINSILGHECRFDQRWVPRCVHTEPAVAAVGWTQQDAEAQGIEYLVVCDAVHLVSDDQRSVIEPEATFLKVLVDMHSWHLLGCLVVGDHAATIANSAAIAIESGLSVKKLREIPMSQPSALEALMATLRKLN
jgi:dihydrolipoamide dehydrogenase